MPDISTAKQLIHIGNILNLVIGALAIISLIITTYGIILVPVPAFLMWWTNKKVKAAEELIEKGNYKGAKDLLIIPSILSLLFVSFIGGLLILIGAIMLPDKGGEEKKENVEVIQ